jgi:hypothetical protein
MHRFQSKQVCLFSTVKVIDNNKNTSLLHNLSIKIPQSLGVPLTVNLAQHHFNGCQTSQQKL